jgi:hypothetical protein
MDERDHSHQGKPHVTPFAEAGDPPMRPHFDPRAMLKQSSISLLRQFFDRRGELQDLPWEEMHESRQFDLIYHAWQSLPDDHRRQVQTIFQDLWDLADERGIRAFADELKAYAPQRAWEFTACHSRLNKVLWFYINYPDLFEKAALFVRADWLSTSRYAVRRNSLPKAPITVTPEIRETLAGALRDYYWPHEMRGRHCHIEHYTRSGGNEYFFAYLDDWPDSRMVFEDSGAFESVSQRYAFSVLFVFCPHDGSLELVTQGTKAVHYPLQRAFSKSVFGIDVEPADPLRSVYRLDQLLEPDFTYPTETTDRIAQVRLTRIRLVPIASSLCPASLEIRFTSKIARRQWIDVIHQQIKALGLTRSQIEVRQASFQLVFLNSGLGRTKTATFTVNLPSSCDLKIGQRCLKRWGILHE